MDNGQCGCNELKGSRGARHRSTTWHPPTGFFSDLCQLQGATLLQQQIAKHTQKYKQTIIAKYTLRPYPCMGTKISNLELAIQIFSHQNEVPTKTKIFQTYQSFFFFCFVFKNSHACYKSNA